jgi:hypothetical protein
MAGAMSYRITYSTASGASRVPAADPTEALTLARAAAADGGLDVWIADDEGRLYSIRELEQFLNRPS